METKLPFDYQIRWSVRAKKARIVVTPDKIEVVSPPQFSEKSLNLFVRRHTNWIVSARDKFQSKLSGPGEALNRIGFQDGAFIPFLGNRYRLTVVPSAAKTVRFNFAQGFFVHVPTDWNEPQQSEAIKKALIRWLKREVKKQVEDIILKYADAYPMIPRSVTIRAQKTRWGSCGPLNDININFRLGFAPYSVLEYVVIHELCHIQHKNHSAAFWNLVLQLMPEYKIHRKWLKLQGHQLLAIV